MMKAPKELQLSCFSDDEDEEDGDEEEENSKDDDDASDPHATAKGSKKRKTPDTSSAQPANKKKSKKTTKTVYKVVDGKSKKVKVSVKKPKVPRAKPQSTSNQRAVTVSSELANVLGASEFVSRPKVVQRLWEYIKEKKLQNPADKREIFLDEPLQKALKAKTCTMFSINKYLSHAVFQAEP